MRIKNAPGTVRGPKASTHYIELPMQSHGQILFRRDFNYSAQLPTVLRWITRSQHARGLYSVHIERRRKSRRAILRDGQSVNYILHVVFRASRMEYAVGFIRPSRKIVHLIRKTSARLHGTSFAQCLAADRIDCSDL